MAKIIVNMQASVVEYTLARQIIYVLGFGATRDADTLKVFKERTNYSLYTGNKELVWELRIDEGMFSGCMDGREQLWYNQPWYELVDFRQLLGLIVKRFSPKFTPRPSTYIGRGRTQQHLIDEYYTEIMRMRDEEPDSDMFELFSFI